MNSAESQIASAAGATPDRSFQRPCRGQTSRAGLTLVGITLVGFLLRVAWIGNSPLWKDELATYIFSTAPIGDLVGNRFDTETNPPGYYLLQKLWLVFGDSRTELRMLPALASTMVIPVVYLIGLRLADSAMAMLAAFFLVTAPMPIHFAREIRCYSVLTLFACTAIACVVWMLPAAENEPVVSKAKKRILSLLLVVSIGICVLLHNTAVLLLPLVSLFIAWDGIVGPARGHWRSRASILGLLAVGSLPFLWWLPTVYRQAFGDLGGPIAWIPEPTPRVVYSMMCGVYPYPWWAKPIVYSLAAIGYLNSLRVPRVAVFLSVFLIGQPLLLLLGSVIATPMFLVNTLLWPSVFFYFPVAIYILRWSIPVRVVVVVALVGLQLYVASSEFVLDRQPDELSDVYRVIDKSGAISQAIVICPISQAFATSYVERNSSRSTIERYAMPYGDGPLNDVIMPWIPVTQARQKDLTELAKRYNTLWIVTEKSPRFPIAEELRLENRFAALAKSGYTIDEIPTQGSARLYRVQAKSENARESAPKGRIDGVDELRRSR
jgi:hypothetical protein